MKTIRQRGWQLMYLRNIPAPTAEFPGVDIDAIHFKLRRVNQWMPVKPWRETKSFTIGAIRQSSKDRNDCSHESQAR